MSADEPITQPEIESGAAARGPTFPVVGVGASAGGLEAFTQFLQHLPPKPGLAFVFVQHLEPNHPSMLDQILGRATHLTVRQAREGMPLEVDHVFLIPPDADMAVQDSLLKLSPRSGKHGTHMPVDHLFRSLAATHKNRAVGVILSGGGTDGTFGFQAIKAEGGITFAQDEQSAKSSSMPRSAFLDGNVDYVLPPAEIARKLLAVTRHPYASQPPDAEPAELPEQDALAGVMRLLRDQTDVDFTQYKRSTILRRIQRRMALRNIETLGDYLKYLEQESAEVANLYQDFLIRVTQFFRDEAVFEALKEKVFPRLAEGRSANAALRVWVTGCATGEEAYSVAICLLEFLGDRSANFPIKILATDLSDVALEKARAGIYLDNIELDVSPERLRRFFGKVDGNYQISKAVRDLCIFSKHNLANDPPFSRLDLVTCRNLLIYLDASLQRRVLPVLHYALNPGGTLVLGTSESIGPFTDLFSVVDAKHRIYVKNAMTPGAISVDFEAFAENTAGSVRHGAPPEASARWSALDVQREADRVVLSKYAPVGVVIDDNFTVLQFRGRTGGYLEPAPGLASLDLLKMVREGLLNEVRTAVGQAKLENAVVRRENIRVKEKDCFRPVDLEVIPIKVPPTGVRCFLVLFQDAPPTAAEPRAAPAPESREATQDQQITQLQQELAATRDYLQSIIEDHESTSEELKSASEEILSSNEELQSTNEELQTAKEETQSANEELSTLNEELRHSNMQLAQLNNDLINLLGAVNIPIVIVGRDLRIRRFTPVTEKVLNLIPTDVGRPLTDIKPDFKGIDFGAKITQVIDSLSPFEGEVQDGRGRWFSLRIRPYVTTDKKIDGASVVLLDVDLLRSELEVRRKGDGEKG